MYCSWELIVKYYKSKQPQETRVKGDIGPLLYNNMLEWFMIALGWLIYYVLSLLWSLITVSSWYNDVTLYASCCQIDLLSNCIMYSWRIPTTWHYATEYHTKYHIHCCSTTANVILHFKPDLLDLFPVYWGNLSIFFHADVSMHTASCVCDSDMWYDHIHTHMYLLLYVNLQQLL